MRKASSRLVILALVISLLSLAWPVAAPAEEAGCGSRGVVATASPPATAVGAVILEAGGNAIDAAVAVGFALAVTHPQAGNVGGGGFMLIRLASDKTAFFDFRECAPAAADREMYLDAKGEVVPDLSLIGHLASGVPGSVAGFAEAHRLYGSLPWSRLLQPAIDLARKGFPVSARLARSLESLATYRDRFPGLAQFAKPDGSPLKEGDLLIQPDLASTLQQISDQGADAFYRGPIADLIVKEMQAGGGIITKADLESYKVVERKPVRGTYRGYDIISAPPPSSGGPMLLEILNIAEGFDLKGGGFLTDASIHRMAEAERRAYFDRARYLGDPDFFRVPLAALTSKKYAEKVRSLITPQASRSNALAPALDEGREKGETTHYSIVDSLGNAVAVTTTLNDSYGSRVVVRGAGFLMNNEMDDFSIKPGVPNLYGLVGSDANAIAPGKRMLSSMAPTIVLKNGELFLVVGTPGGATIITTVAQVIIDMIDFGMSLRDAVSAPRFHHQWLPDRISLEPGQFPVYLQRALIARGHELEIRTDPIGDVQAIAIQDGVACGVSDPRGGGLSLAAGAAAAVTH
jgi:gamma-glutamyltranspeptidase/glutathione hydrolase